MTGRNRRPRNALKTTYLFLGLSIVSLLVMIVIDAILGPSAEFLNAFSVVQRIAGQVPTAGKSMVAQQIGVAGELLLVVVGNLIIGAGLTVLARRLLKQ